LKRVYSNNIRVLYKHHLRGAVYALLIAALVLSRLDYGNGTLFGQPVYHIRRLQLFQNAAARLIFQLRRSDHITDAVVILHWLRVPERIVFRVAVQTYRAMVTWREFTRTADIPSQFSAQTPVLSHRLSMFVPAVRLSAVGRRALPVAGARIWNDLPLTLPSHRCCSHLSAYFGIRTRGYHS